MDITKLFELIEVEQLSSDFQENITLWNSWYKGFVSDFHEYSESNGANTYKRTRRSLQMAKEICEEWADVSFNPEAQITVDESYQSTLDNILEANNFESMINDALEKMYALGTMATITTKIKGEPKVHYVTADMLYPVAVNDTTGWAVISELNEDIFYVSISYYHLNSGKWLLENHLIDVSENEEGVLISEDSMRNDYGVDAVVVSSTPLIQVFRTGIANNVDFFSPYGLSVYANSIDQLESVDIAYSSLGTEIETGKMLLFTTVENLEFSESEIQGPKLPDKEGWYVTENQQAFEDGTTVKTHSPTLRSESMIKTLETSLNVLGRSCGFGNQAFSFDNGVVYTNTEQVISTQSKFYKTRQKFLVPIEESLKEVVKALLFIKTGREYKGSISIDFDDSLVHDKEREQKELDFQLMNGLISEVYYWQVKKGLTEELAKEFVAKQLELKNLTIEIDSADDENEEE